MYTAGAVNKKLKKFPDILTYLEVHYPKVFDLIDSLAMRSALHPRRGMQITFLIPDEKLTKELTSLVESEEIEKAAEILSHLILYGLFTSPTDFNLKKNNIVSRLGKRFIITEVKNDRVIIPGGELVIDKEFKQMESLGKVKLANSAVWLLKGRVDVESAPVVEIPKANVGSDEHNMNNNNKEVMDKLRVIKRETYEKELKYLRENAKNSAYLEAVVRVLRSFQADKKYKDEYIKFRCILKKHPIIDFCYLFCAHKIFDPVKVLSAYEEGYFKDEDVSTYLKICEDYPSDKNYESLLLKKSEALKVANLANDIRQSLLESPNKLGIAKEIIKIYDKLDSDNTLSFKNITLSEIYPKIIHEIFKENRCLHLVLDQFAWDVYKVMQYVHKHIDKEKPEAFREAISHLIDSYHPFFYKPLDVVVFDKLDNWKMDSDQIYNIVFNFVRTFMLHFPCRGETEMVKVGSAESKDPYSSELIDIDEQLEKVLKEYEDVPAALSTEELKKLQSIVKKYGKDKIMELIGTF
ncbi:MAG: hypothetical protein QW303_00575 [Nitrososphaerota archaeon]